MAVGGKTGIACPDCRNSTILTSQDLGESYCSSCGLVMDRAFDYSMRWYADKGTSYQKTSYTHAYKRLGTVDPDSLPRCRGMQVTEEETIESNFSNASHALHVIWRLWQVPIEIREECAIIYRKLIKKGITHGRKTHAMAIAVTFLACEKYGIVRDWEELAERLNIGHSALEKCLKAAV